MQHTFHIVRELSRGGMATVYLAEQVSLKREVALKVLDPSLAGDSGFIERFQREGRSIAGLHHRHIVTVYDIGVLDDKPFISMEYLPLGSIATNGYKLDPPDVLRCVREIAGALNYAHEHGIVHRDVKPANILRHEQGAFLLSDFGIARVNRAEGPTTGEGRTLGTPGYMSPEQWRNENLDGRSDLYSLGIVLYELLTRALPVGSTANWTSETDHIAHVPTLPSQYAALQGLLAGLLAPDREDRFPSGAEVVALIESIEREGAIPDKRPDKFSTPPSNKPRVSRLLREWPHRAAAAASYFEPEPTWWSIWRWRVVAGALLAVLLAGIVAWQMRGVQPNVSAEQRSAVPPTQNAAALDAFLKAEYAANKVQETWHEEDFLAADAKYQQAIALDPKFALAYARLAYNQMERHWNVKRLSAAELADVKATIDHALALMPELPQAHLALGYYYYFGFRKYDEASEQFQHVLQQTPNDVKALAGLAFVSRRRGQWQLALSTLQKALVISPRDHTLMTEYGATYTVMRRYPEAEQILTRALALAPDDDDSKSYLYVTRLFGFGNAQGARMAYDPPPAWRLASDSGEGGEFHGVVGGAHVYPDLFERHFDDALATWKDAPIRNDGERLIQRVAMTAIKIVANRQDLSQSECNDLKSILEAKAARNPDAGGTFVQLSWVDLCLNRKTEAIANAQRAVDLLSMKMDAYNGAYQLENLAEIEARAGAPDEALKVIEQLLSIPAGQVMTIERLKLDPLWDPLRDNPRFQELLQPHAFASKDAAQSSAPARPLSTASIAVLPFVDMSQTKDQAYFSDGLSEELLDLLAKVPGLHVSGRTSSFSFKGKNARLSDIGRELNVANALEGSVRKSGNRIRIATKLIKIADGFPIWSETYDRQVNDVFAVQDEIAAAVVEALKLKLLPSGHSRSIQHRTINPDAYDQYLLGRQQESLSNPKITVRAVETYRKAIALDPDFAAAYAGLAIAEYYSADTALTASDLELAKQKALAAAEKAVALDPELAEGYQARAHLRTLINADWNGAQADYERALALSPADTTTLRRYGILLASLGKLPEAIDTTNKALELDPLSSSAWSNLGRYLLATRGRQTEAMQALTRAVEIDPESVFSKFNLGFGHMVEGNAAAALGVFQRMPTGNYLQLAGVAMAEYALGHFKESQQALDALISAPAQRPYGIAWVYMARGDRDQTFAWLDRAYYMHDAFISTIKTEPFLAPMQDDPRFAALLKKMGLPP